MPYAAGPAPVVSGSPRPQETLEEGTLTRPGPEHQQDDHRRSSGDGEDEHPGPDDACCGDDRCHEQGSGEGPDLVHGLLDAKPLSAAHCSCCLCQQGGLRWAADGLAAALQQDQCRSDGQAGRAEEGRHGEEWHAHGGETVAGDRQGPVSAGPVRQRSEDESQHEGHRLPEARDQSDDECRRAEGGEERPVHGARPLVDHVGGQADEAEPDHDPPLGHRSGHTHHDASAQGHLRVGAGTIPMAVVTGPG